MTYCRYCSRRLLHVETDVHPECAAEMRRRMADGECLWCGSRGLVDGGYWCGTCRDNDGREYAGYPGGI